MVKETKIRPSGGYFAAANTGGGFVSYYDRIYDTNELDRLLIIKGGSGTGKSSFLRKLAGAAESKGCRVEYFFCSSDPDSLDGILFRDRSGRLCGSIDGTAPHLRDTELPGACDSIYDLGQFWDKVALIAERGRISELYRKKSELYACVYRELSAAGAHETTAEDIAKKYLDYSKMEAAVARTARLLSSGRKGELLRPTDSFGMKGRVRLDTLPSEAVRTYRVVGYGAGKYLSELRKNALERGVYTITSPALLRPTEPCALYFPDSGICFSAEERGFDMTTPKSDGRVNMERFLRVTDRDDRSAIRHAVRLRDDEFSLAGKFFERIRAAHSELESIYGSAMDFERKDAAEAKLMGEFL